MIIAPDSSIVIGTSTLSYGSATASFYLMKIDRNGKILWGEAIGEDQVSIAHALINAPGGGFIMAGYTSDKSLNDPHIFIIKTNDSGGVDWGKTYYGFGLVCLNNNHNLGWGIHSWRYRKR